MEKNETVSENDIKQMHKKYRYNVGDKLGPDNILFLKRLDCNKNYAYKGLFQCPHCDEHKEFVARISHVVQGRVRSCGCLSGNKKDLTGKVYYNNVIALKPTDIRDKDGSIIWCCKCLWCGSIFQVSSTRLENGSVSSCGCSSGSLGERIIFKMLTEYGIPFIKEYSFDGFIKNNKPYRFDYYVNNSYLIEIDGQYHTETERAKDDEIKNNYCKLHNIPLIRIPIDKLRDISINDILLESSQYIVN